MIKSRGLHYSSWFEFNTFHKVSFSIFWFEKISNKSFLFSAVENRDGLLIASELSASSFNCFSLHLPRWWLDFHIFQNFIHVYMAVFSSFWNVTFSWLDLEYSWFFPFWNVTHFEAEFTFKPIWLNFHHSELWHCRRYAANTTPVQDARIPCEASIWHTYDAKHPQVRREGSKPFILNFKF